MNYGLIGKNLVHSFSKAYFLEKFKSMELHDYSYKNFEFTEESGLALFLLDKVYELDGFNVTIPYKEIIIPYLDKLHISAKKAMAVNTVLIKDKELIGYNTDVYGFKKSLKPLLEEQHKKALIFGTGGASKAVAIALDSLSIPYTYVSRSPVSKEVLNYEALTKEVLDSHQILINCTPLGTFPDTDSCIDIPFRYLNKYHLAFDLVYNPKETLFLKKAKEQGAITQNGLDMLTYQAEKAWDIWADLKMR